MIRSSFSQSSLKPPFEGAVFRIAPVFNVKTLCEPHKPSGLLPPQLALHAWAGCEFRAPPLLPWPWGLALLHLPCHHQPQTGAQGCPLSCPMLQMGRLVPERGKGLPKARQLLSFALSCWA